MAVPILALAMGPVEAVVSMTLVSLVLAGWASLRERAHVDVPIARRMIIAGVVGMPLGLVLLAYAGPAVLQILMAVTVVTALVVIGVGWRLRPGAAAGWSTGVLSGVLLTSTGMNGPPLVLGLTAQNPTPLRFRGTLQLVFFAHDLVAVLGFVVVAKLTPAALLLAAVGVVASPVGWLVGDRIFHRIRPDLFRWVLVAGLAVSAVLLVADQLR